MAFRWRVIPGTELTPDMSEAWIGVQESNPLFDSPYFRPEFTAAVAAARDSVEVAILENDGELVGFFPYDRQAQSGFPAGGRLSDFQGAVVRTETNWTVAGLMSACRLQKWSFSNLIAEQHAFRPFHAITCDSLSLDLSNGFEGYANKRREAGSLEIKHTFRKLRRAEREIGPLRFEYHTDNPRTWESLKYWKRSQYLQSRMIDILAVEWVAELVDRIWQTSRPGFSGVLSTLCAGDRLLAAHFGMRSHEVMHWWFPAYNPEFGRYSPGLLLLLQFARQSEELGIKRIDLGKSGQEFKRRWASDARLVAEGCVASSSWHCALRTQWCRTRDWLRTSPWGGAARVAADWLRPLRTRRAFR